MSKVNFMRLDYVASLADWTMATDVMIGDRALKFKDIYLPAPSDDAEQYDVYKKRALFYNTPAHTVAGLIGAVSRKPATIELPPAIEALAGDIDGNGLSLQQQANAVISRLLTHGRTALFVDYPNLEKPASKQDQIDQNIRPSIIHVKAESIINWRDDLIVIEEIYEELDGFSSKSKTQYRVLRLEGGHYAVEIWRKGSADFEMIEQYQPRDGKGSLWTVIPFVFVGAENNDATIDRSPLLGMMELAIKHFQIGADWYNALHYAGQPQPSITGLDKEWRDHLEKTGVKLGSVNALLLPKFAAYNLTTSLADTAINAEMKALEDRMIALGARIVQEGGTVKTATQSSNDNATEHSILSLIVSNVNDAYTQALEWLMMYQNVDGEVNFELNSEFFDKTQTPQEIMADIQLYDRGIIAKADIREALRKTGRIERTDEDIDNDTEDENPLDVE